MAYYNNTNSSQSNTDNNLFVSRFLNHRNKQDHDIFGLRQTTSSNLSQSGRTNKKNQENIEEDNTKPYRRVQKGQPLHMRSQIDICVTESSRGNNLNASVDPSLKQNNARKQDDNELTFGKPITKNKRTASMDNTIVDYSKLICDNCLNTQLGAVKKIKNKDDDEIYIRLQEENNKFVDSINQYHKKQIAQKLRNREDLTEIAAQGVKEGRRNEKEALQRSCENAEFGLLKGNYDPAQKRLLAKNQMSESIRQKNVEKFYKNGKSDKDRDENVQPFLGSIGSTSRETDKQSYFKDLQEQSQNKELLAEKNSIVERNKGLETVLLNKNKFEIAEKERLEKERKLKEEFIEENNKLIDKKNRKMLVKKHVDYQNDKEYIMKNNEQLEKEIQENNLKKSQLQNELLRGLNKQLNEKNKMRSSSQGKIDESAFTCKNHDCRYPCAKCNKKYPLNMLNNKDTAFGKGYSKKY